MKTVCSRIIYRAVDLYDDDMPEFDCYRPVYTGSFLLVDCWPCTADGEIHPSCDCAPVPIDCNGIGDPVGAMPEA